MLYSVFIEPYNLLDILIYDISALMATQRTQQLLNPSLYLPIYPEDHIFFQS